MRRGRSALVLAVIALVFASFAPGVASSAAPSKPTVATADPLAILRATANQLGMGDPDLPPVGHEIDPKTYLMLRSQQEALYRGAPFTLPYNARAVAIQRFNRQVAGRVKTGPVWTAIGPAPIPNGQTSPQNAVSGRVTAIAVDPTDANVVYVGTAQGGVYRSLNGGSTWIPLMDNALSLAIGSLAIPPSDHTILYVGTGEGNLSGDSYAGVGLYRINGANGATPVLNGPFESRVANANLGTGAGNGHAFSFLAIQGIAVDPANADRVYLSATPGGVGVGNTWVCCVSPSADPGLYFTSNGTAATPTFSKVNDGLPQSSGSFIPASTDVKFLQGSSSTLLVGIEDIGFGTSNNNGIWRSITADQLTPTFSHIALPNTPFNTRIATSTAKVVVGAETGSGGRLFLSTDGGATFPTTVTTANGFCGGQCFYDMAPAIDPNNANNMLLGGSADSGGAFVLMRSTNATPSFAQSDAGLHADSHATTYAVTNTGVQHVVYAGNDGGIFKSTDGGATWSSLNNSGFSATQFESLAVHPTDPNFTIGGTQDNGTEWYKPNATWTRADFGDGGFARIDQTASNTTNVTMYHTYFNQTNNLIGFARVTSTANATEGNWNFFGCGGTANGIACGDDPLFYAPLELGPVVAASGGHQTVYFGTDKLYRSVNQGTSMTAVSQSLGGGFSGHVSAIGIAPTDDTTRIIGGSGGQLFGTTSGTSGLDTLANLDNSNQIPNSYVARIAIDPTNHAIAYVTIGGFQGGTTAADSHVWKTTNINGTATSWTAINTGLPDVPVNAFVIDPNDHTHLFAGTDIGVYASTDSGAHWAPFGTGLPVVAVFDMAIAQPGTASEVLRVATHGRGMYEASLGGGGGNVTLTVTRSGSGGGTVVSDDGHINCPGSCSFSYPPTTVVHLTATPDGTSTFGQWTGCDSAVANACTQTLNGNETVDASFDANGGDTTNPTASMTKPTASVTISKSVTLQWTASDNVGGSGLADVDLQMKSAKFNARFGSFTQPAALQHLGGTSTVFTGKPGTSYCFEVRARDNVGNLSAFSAQKCTMIPVDDKTLTVNSGSWQRRSGQSGAFQGTLTTTSAKNASLGLSSVRAKQLGVLVKRCSSCGTFSITYAGNTFTANTQGSGFVIFTIPATSTVKTSNLTLKVTTTGKLVQIDAVAASQTGAISTAFTGAQTVRLR